MSNHLKYALYKLQYPKPTQTKKLPHSSIKTVYGEQ